MPVALRLKPGKEKSVLRRHPWIFSSAIDQVQGSPAPGETVLILSSQGEFLAWGAFSPVSQIRIRIWSWEADQSIDPEFFANRLKKAVSWRLANPGIEITNAVRLVFGESDGIPGFIVDKYADVLVCQFLSCGAEYWRAALIDALGEILQMQTIYERSDVDVRRLEGLESRSGPVRGNHSGGTQINEFGLRYNIDYQKGQKTGFFLDQRTNRHKVQKLSAGREVLDCFCYSGGFLLNALVGGATSAAAIDDSQDALILAADNLEINQLDADGVEWIKGDVFQVLRKFRDQDRSFDMIILDPPKFAPTIQQAERAARGYKDINLLAFKLLRQDGILVTFSCSGGIDKSLFQKIIASAALDAGANAQIIDMLHQDFDHPVSLNFPEGEYLKGLIIRKSA